MENEDLDFLSQINSSSIPLNRISQPIPFVLAQFKIWFLETFPEYEHRVLKKDEQKEANELIVKRLNYSVCRSVVLDKLGTVYRVFKKDSDKHLPQWYSYTEKNLKAIFSNFTLKYEAAEWQENGPRRQSKKPVVVTPITVWMSSLDSLCIDNFIFDPKSPPGLTENEEGLKTWNSFCGLDKDFTRPIENVESAREKLATIIFHLRHVLCKGEERLFTWLEKWLAHVIQFPWIKSHVAPIFVGPQGSGKSMFWENFSRLFGPHGKVFSDPSLLTHKFYGHELSTVIFAVLNEVEFGKHNDSLTKGKIKNIITNDTRKAESKGGDVKEVSDFMSMVWTSNEKQSFPVENGYNRRYLPINISSHFAQNLNYFKDLAEAFDQTGLNALYHYLLRIPVEENALELKEAPFTEEKSQLIATTLDEFLQWWREILLNGVHTLSVTRSLSHTRDPDARDWIMSNSSKLALFNKFFSTLTTDQQKDNVNVEKFYSRLHEMLPYCENWESNSDLFDMPPLLDCRIHFQKSIGVYAGAKDNNWISNKRIKMTKEIEEKKKENIQKKLTDFF